MTITLPPQQAKQSEAGVRPEDAPQDGLRRWTADEYHRMIEMGIFDGARVELIKGGIWQVEASDFYRWTPDQYHTLMEAGFFNEGRVELLGGLIWDMSGQLTPHATGVRLVTLALEDVFAKGFEVRAQLPVTLPDGTEPEPDIAIAPGTPLDYLEHHPRAEELLLVAEVSDSTLVKDRGLKLASYAQAWIIEYWIVNLIDHQLEVYRRPSPAGFYTDFQVYQPGASIAPLHAPNKPVAVANLLPPEPKKNL